MGDIFMIYEPGMKIKLEDVPEFGIGIVQSAIGNKLTVMFPEAGKRIIFIDRAKIEMIFE